MKREATILTCDLCNKAEQLALGNTPRSKEWFQTEFLMANGVDTFEKHVCPKCVGLIVAHAKYLYSSK